MKKLAAIFCKAILCFLLLTFFQQKAFSQAGTHLNFDGVNDYIACPSAPFSNQSFTITFWARRTGGFGQYQYISSQGTDAGDQFVGVLYRLTNVISFSFWANDLDGVTPITNSNWNHYAVTYNAATRLQAIYLNGVLDASRVSTANTTASGPLFLGGFLGASQTFFGDLEEYRIWNSALPQSEISRMMSCELQGNETGLIRYYKFNQGTGAGNNTAITTVADAASSNQGSLLNFARTGTASNFMSGSAVTTGNITPAAPGVVSSLTYVQGANASALTATGSNRLWYTAATGGTGTTTAPTPSTLNVGSTIYYVSQTTGSCESPRAAITVNVTAATATHLSFDGVNDYVNAGVRSGLDMSAGTIEAWIRPQASSQNKVIIANRSSDAVTRWSFHLNQGNGTVGLWNGSGYVAISVGAITAGAWYHIAFAFSNSSVIVYLNGNNVGTIAQGINTASTGNPVLIGSADAINQYPNEYWSGEMDEVRIWNSILSVDDIVRRRNCELNGNETGLMLYYRMNQGLNGGNNAAQTNVHDITANDFDGVLTNFAKTGSTSNFVNGSPVATGIIVPDTPGGPGTQPFCGVTTVGQLTPEPSGTISWYAATSGGTALSPSTSITSFTNQYVAASNSYGCASARKTVSVIIGSTTLAAGNMTFSANVTGRTWFPSSCSNLVASVNNTGASPISGSTTARVWVEGTQPVGFVRRHYEITPAANASTATGNVTLYFTQAEFNNFNAVYSPKLPTNSGDAAGIANIRIEKRGGISNNSTGLPPSYTGTITTIDPDDDDIRWNATNSRWEVSFDVTGFSGFFLKTTNITLPVTLLNFTAKVQADKTVQLQWQTEDERNLSHYEVERGNSSVYSKVNSDIPAFNNGQANSYTLTDAAAWTNDIRYYRIKMVDNDGRFKYSTIVRVSQKGTSVVSIYPNPVKDFVTIQVGSELLRTTANITDVTGRIVKQVLISHTYTTTNMADLPAGVYLLKFEDGTSTKMIKK